MREIDRTYLEAGDASSIPTRDSTDMLEWPEDSGEDVKFAVDASPFRRIWIRGFYGALRNAEVYGAWRRRSARESKR